jgi:hypothetical protein
LDVKAGAEGEDDLEPRRVGAILIVCRLRSTVSNGTRWFGKFVNWQGALRNFSVGSAREPEFEVGVLALLKKPTKSRMLHNELPQPN